MQLLKMILSGIKKTKNILIILMMIGMLTALWRAGGTIPMIIYSTIRLIHPNTVLLMVFLLNCCVSLLTGTAFGTAATMGVIGMTMATSLNINPVLTGGAILSGVFFGDRCSPVSTSALLISELTQTNIFVNIKKMLRSALLPFILTCAIYAVVGLLFDSADELTDLCHLFAGEFNLHWSVLLPALAILLLSVFKINVKITMLVSIVSAFFICLVIQRMELSEITKALVFGYSANAPAVGAMLNGGGIISMLRVMAIIAISSAYAGIFQETGLLRPIKKLIVATNGKITAYGGTLFTSIVISVVACNQTLTIMLTHQLNNEIVGDSQKLAIDLEDTAVVIAPLVPWSIAGAVPLATVGAPTASLLAACFLYLVPVFRLSGSLLSKNRQAQQR